MLNHPEIIKEIDELYYKASQQNKPELVVTILRLRIEVIKHFNEVQA